MGGISNDQRFSEWPSPVRSGRCGGRNRPSWNRYQRDENIEKAADWIKPHHGLFFTGSSATTYIIACAKR